MRSVSEVNTFCLGLSTCDATVHHNQVLTSFFPISEPSPHFFPPQVSVWFVVSFSQEAGSGWLGRSGRRGLADLLALLQFKEVAHRSGMVHSLQQCSALTAECSDRVGGMPHSDYEGNPLSRHFHPPRVLNLLLEDDVLCTGSGSIKMCLLFFFISKLGKLTICLLMALSKHSWFPFRRSMSAQSYISAK